MQKSESIKNIAAALLTFQAKMEKIKKDSDNPFFKSKYASLSTILEHIQMPLAESGLSFSQLPDGEDCLTTILMHAESGEWIQSSFCISPVKKDPQATGSAITYARRYALGAILGLNIEEDDDGNSATFPDKRKQYDEKNNQDLRPWLNEEQFIAMKKAINDGKHEEVRVRMSKYRMKKLYKEELESYLNNN